MPLIVSRRRAPKRSRSGNQIRRKRSYQRGQVGSIHQHHFVRCCSTAGVVPVKMDSYAGFGSANFDLQLVFTLGGVLAYLGGGSSVFFTCSMPNYSELTALYDQYRIDYVECEFYFNSNSSSTSQTTISLPIMYVAKDYDDSGPSTVTALQQYSNVRTWQLGNERGTGKYVIKVKPNVDVTVFNGSLSAGYARGKPMFIDTASSAVPHYGIKMAFDPIVATGAASTIGYLSMNFKYHLTMANTK